MKLTTTASPDLSSFIVQLMTPLDSVLVTTPGLLDVILDSTNFVLVERHLLRPYQTMYHFQYFSLK
ncbi:hypothetical protein MGH68_02085 [Erysipelothrix sp. D19-032]